MGRFLEKDSEIARSQTKRSVRHDFAIEEQENFSIIPLKTRKSDIL